MYLIIASGEGLLLYYEKKNGIALNRISNSAGKYTYFIFPACKVHI
jgi:hypothetical protein